jgi:hypothetical protein
MMETGMNENGDPGQPGLLEPLVKLEDGLETSHQRRTPDLEKRDIGDGASFLATRSPGSQQPAVSSPVKVRGLYIGKSIHCG